MCSPPRRWNRRTQPAHCCSSRRPPSCFLLFLIIKLKLHAFLALILVSLLVALAARVPPGDVVTTLTTGFGSTLASVALLVGLGAMLGRLLHFSGGAQVLADSLVRRFGEKRAPLARGAALLLNTGLSTLATAGTVDGDSTLVGLAQLIGFTPVALLITVLVAMLVLGRHRGASAAKIESVVNSALRPVCAVILITGAGGMFGGVLRARGIGEALDPTDPPRRP